MPRTQITLFDTPSCLSILDEEGNVDTGLEPDIAPSRLLEMYTAMLLGRRLDERMLDLQRQGRIGTFPPIKGQEAPSVGAIVHLKPSDWFVPSFRETPAEIWRGRSLASILLYYNGFNEGAILPPRQRDLPMAIPIASQIPHAVGLGYAARYKKRGEVVMTFFGDGATSEGDFHEGLNCAAVYRLPVVFICQNNQWAISVPVARQTTTPIAQKGLAYGIPSIRVDGNDILAIHAAAGEAVARARNGDGPTLIECLTYRVMMHTTADDPNRYRQPSEVEEWQARDPLLRFATYLSTKGILTDVVREKTERETKARIAAAVEEAERLMEKHTDPSIFFDHMYSEPPPSLARQKEEFVARQTASATGGAS